MITRNAFIISLLLSATVFLSGCKTAGTDAGPSPAPVANVVPATYLVSATEIKSLTKPEIGTQNIKQFSTGIQGSVSGLLKYDITVYKLIYNTKLPDGTAIKASGAVIVPKVTTAVPMMSLQHGTITVEADAPSNFGLNSDAAASGTLFGSIGYIVVCPDFIGYGESKALPHTYEHRNGLATASIDMIRAAREFVKKQSINWNSKLVLTGYSEGGFATMALQKKIEDEFPTEFPLTASSVGAGAYHKTAFLKHIINEKTKGISGYNQLYLWTLLTYNDLYKLNKPASYFLKEPYATQVTQNGKNVVIKVSINEIFTDSFKKGINDGTETAFLNAAKDNDVHDWKPKTPTYLYHGTADDLVFFFNSQDAFDAMRKRGATNVDIKPLKDRGHSSAFAEYLIGTYNFFATAR